MTTEIEYLNENKKSVTYKIVMKKVSNVDLSWITHVRPGLDEANRDQTGLQVLDIIMRHSLQLRFISVSTINNKLYILHILHILHHLVHLIYVTHFNVCTYAYVEKAKMRDEILFENIL